MKKNRKIKVSLICFLLVFLLLSMMTLPVFGIESSDNEPAENGSVDTLWIIGQIFGILAIITGCLSFQMRTQKQLLLVQTLTSVIFCFHYGMIGAMTGMAMNLVNIFRNLAYDHRNQKNKTGWLVPIIFTVINTFMAILAWDAWYSIFMLVGIGINTLAMALPDPQKVRISILITSPIVIVYNVLSFSIGSVIYEVVAIVSCIIALLRNRSAKVNKT